MNQPAPTYVAPIAGNAAECAAALVRPFTGFRGAKYDPHAPVFTRLSRANIEGADPFATIEAIYRERDGTWRFRVRCPHCNHTHMHGGRVGPVPIFGHRIADCLGGGGYSLVVMEVPHE